MVTQEYAPGSDAELVERAADLAFGPADFGGHSAAALQVTVRFYGRLPGRYERWLVMRFDGGLQALPMTVCVTSPPLPLPCALAPAPSTAEDRPDPELERLVKAIEDGRVVEVEAALRSNADVRGTYRGMAPLHVCCNSSSIDAGVEFAKVSRREGGLNSPTSAWANPTPDGRLTFLVWSAPP